MKNCEENISLMIGLFYAPKNNKILQNEGKKTRRRMNWTYADV